MSSFIVRQSDGESVKLDNTRIETYVPSLTVTSHPVEEGNDISDHVKRNPEVITLSGFMTESPRDQPGVEDLGTGVDRIQRFLDFMKESEGQFVDIISSKLGTFTNLLIERYPHRITPVRNLPIDISFRDVRIAEVGLVIIPPPAQEVGMTDPQDVGNQSTSDTAGTDAQDQSIAFSLLESIGLVGG